MAEIKKGRTVAECSSYSVTEYGVVFGPRGVMTPQKDKDGYLYVRLYLGRGKYKKKFLHRLVWETYVGPIPKHLVCCHNDGTRDNNLIDNLRVDTQAANCADKRAHGTWQVGDKHPRTKTSQAKVRRVRELLASQTPYHGWYVDLARAVGVSVHVVYDINRGKRCEL